MGDLTIEITGLRELIGKLDNASQLNFNLRAIVGTNLKYAEIVSKGSRPHTITARPGGALYWKGAAHPVMSVRHPGTKPNPYVENAVATARPQAIALLESRVVAAIEGQGGNYRQAFAQAGQLVQAAVQRGAPSKTGTLRASWHTEVMA